MCPQVGLYTQANADADIATHAADASAHHAKYTDAAALAAAIAGGLSEVVWKDTPSNALTDLNRTVSLDWTDLDLTAFTSANAKFAILLLRMNIDAHTDGDLYLHTLQNGTTPSVSTMILVKEANAVASSFWEHYCIIGLDTGQVIQYKITLTGTAQIDSYLEVLGYIE